MLFKSSYPDIDIPEDISTWEFLFKRGAHPAIPFHRPSLSTTTTPSPTPTFTNAITKHHLTHSQVCTLATNLSTSLVYTHHFRPGDVVSIISSNSIWYPAALFGIMRLGGVPALSSQKATVEEMVHVFRTVRSRAVFVGGEQEELRNVVDVVREAVRRVEVEGRRGKMEIWMLTEKGFEELRGLQELCEEGRRGREEESVEAWGVPERKSNKDFSAVLCFSSGTTGLPKAVMITHHNLIAQCLQLLPTTSTDHRTILGLLPFFHITGVIKMLMLSFVLPASVIILPKFTMPLLLSTISTYQIAEIQVVPPIIIRLVNDPIVDQYDLSCIKRFASGAAPISTEVLRGLEKRFPERGFKQGYGMTESVGCISTHPLGKHGIEYARMGGTLVANTVVRVVSEDGRDVGVGEKGEIRVKGPQIVPGYINNPVATSSCFDEQGFLRTGDEGSIDDEGFLTIHDRIKEMIKVKGIQVAPAELEDLLLGHAAVRDCAVIGVPDAYSGERPLGWVVLKEGVKSKAKKGEGGRGGVEEELMEWVRQKTMRSKWLVGIRIMDEIPKSTSGKILRRILREKIKGELSGAQAKL